MKSPWKRVSRDLAMLDCRNERCPCRTDSSYHDLDGVIVGGELVKAPEPADGEPRVEDWTLYPGTRVRVGAKVLYVSRIDVMLDWDNMRIEIQLRERNEYTG